MKDPRQLELPHTQGDIRDAIKALSARWIAPEYAREVSIPRQIDYLIIKAFIDRVADGEETALLREAYRRLHEEGAVVGTWTYQEDAQ